MYAEQFFKTSTHFAAKGSFPKLMQTLRQKTVFHKYHILCGKKAFIHPKKAPDLSFGCSFPFGLVVFNCTYRALLLCFFGTGRCTAGHIAVAGFCNALICHGENLGTYRGAKTAADAVAVYKKFHNCLHSCSIIVRIYYAAFGADYAQGGYKGIQKVLSR